MNHQIETFCDGNVAAEESRLKLRVDKKETETRLKQCAVQHPAKAEQNYTDKKNTEKATLSIFLQFFF